jgi:hypothetical protein
MTLLLGVIVWSFSGESELKTFHNTSKGQETSSSFSLKLSSLLKSDIFFSKALAATDNSKTAERISLALKVSDIEKAKNEINKILKENDAYINESGAPKTEKDVVLYDLVLKVPNQKIEKILEEFDTLGKVSGGYYKTVDITQEYENIIAEIENLEGRLNSLQDLLKSENPNNLSKINQGIVGLQLGIDTLNRAKSSIKLPTIRVRLVLGSNSSDPVQEKWSLGGFWKNSVSTLLGTINNFSISSNYLNYFYRLLGWQKI